MKLLSCNCSEHKCAGLEHSREILASAVFVLVEIRILNLQNEKYLYVQFKVQLDVFFMYSLFFFILSSTCVRCYLHPSSGAQLQHTAIGVCMVLVC
jgi:hypothetical protein